MEVVHFSQSFCLFLIPLHQPLFPFLSLSFSYQTPVRAVAFQPKHNISLNTAPDTRSSQQKLLIMSSSSQYKEEMSEYDLNDDGEDEPLQVGAVYTNENEDSDYDDANDDDDDDDDDDADEEDKDEEGALSYLFDKSNMKQHAFAILVALVATGISYFHFNGNGNGSPPIPISTQTLQRTTPLKPTAIHHHHSYKRTSNLIFCPLETPSPAESYPQRIQKALNTDRHIEGNLQLFQFNLPKQYIDIINDYYIADETFDDFYNHTLTIDNGEMTENVHFQCLVDTMSIYQKSTVPMHSIAYIHPSIATYYKNQPANTKPKSNISVKSILEGRNDETEMTPASLTYTGFTAKFINLSTKPMHLFWDGKNKPRFRGKIDPFESFTTVTTPGNSFYLAPTYDKEHAVERWTMTADEAVVSYNPLHNDVEMLAKLTMAEMKMYTMQKLNMAYGQEYLVKTQRSWLSMFPRPLGMHYMWEADYFGQEYVVKTEQSHFVSVPKGKEVWRRLDYADYDNMVEESDSKGKAVLNLAEHRNEGALELKLRVISVAPRVFEIDNFLSNVEVEHLLEMATKYNSTDVRNRKQRKGDATTNAWIRREMSPIIDAIYHRSADLMKIDESLLRHRNEHEHTELNTHHSIAEAMHISQYKADQGYIPRSDAAQPSIKNRFQPNRFATIMFFLNDVEEDMGGDTMFPLAVNADHHDGIRVVPKKGKALLFYNMLPDGNADDLSQYSSEFVKEGVDGEKWLGSIFVWDPIID